MKRPTSGPRSVVTLIVVLGALGVIAAGIDHVAFGPHPVSWPWVVPLTALLVAGGSFQVRFRYRDEVEALDLFEAVLAPVLFAYAGWAVVAMVFVANVIEGLLRRNEPVKAAFNVAQWTAAAGVGALVLSSLRTGSALTGHNVAALVAALAVVLVLNHLSFLTVVALSQRHSLWRVLGGLRGLIVPGWLLGGALSLAFGLLFVTAYQWSPAVMPLFCVPLVSLNWASAAYAAARADEVRLHALHRASAVLSGPVDPLDAVGDFLAEVRSCFEAETAELWLVGEDGTSMYRSPDEGEPFTKAMVQQLLALDSPVRMAAADRLRTVAWRDCLAAPLLDGDETIGVLCTYNRTGLEGFEDGELAVLGALAGDVVAALQRGRLVQRVMDERRNLRDIVESASDGIFTLAADGSVTSWNPALAEITGYGPDDLLGRTDLGVLRPRDGERRDVMLEHWADIEVVLPEDLQILTRDGEWRWVSCSYSRVAGVDGAQDSLIVIARDVTKVREVERLREDFVATVSHELRTPLSPIKGWAATLLDFGDKLDEEDRRKGLQSILRQSQRLERLVVNLLEVSKIEHGALEAAVVDVDVSAVAARVVDDFQAAWPDRTFHLDGAETPAWCRAKELWVEQILSNLVSNAVKYSPDGEPVELTLDRGLDYVSVVVLDHGCGIPAHELERVFDRFHRVRETLTQTGTGLGLYIARQLAEETGGRITVESVPGRGSRFALELPAATRIVDVRPDNVVRLEAG